MLVAELVIALEHLWNNNAANAAPKPDAKGGILSEAGKNRCRLLDLLRISRSMAIRFEWDPAKAGANWRKHKITFQQAREVFKDGTALDEADDREDYGEERFNRIGMVERRLLVVTYTGRVDEDTGGEIIRIISARLAERHERKRYHEG